MKTAKTKKKTKYFICSRLWKPGRVFYVREVLGEGGADWGYVDERRKARPISTYWARRFIADMQRVGATGVSCVECVSTG
jgi:hypothetical protein